MVLKELEHVVDFLYYGETNVAQEGLNSFLETAQELLIKGLEMPHGGMGKRKPEEVNTALHEESKLPVIDTNLSKSTIFKSESNFNFLEEVSDDNILDNGETDVDQPDENNLMIDANIQLDLQLEQMMERREGLWHCKVCGRTSKDKANTRRHTEIHTEGVSHACYICVKKCPTRNSLQAHIARNHSEVTKSKNKY